MGRLCGRIRATPALVLLMLALYAASGLSTAGVRAAPETVALRSGAVSSQASDTVVMCADPEPERAMDAVEQTMLDQVNAYRSQIGAPAVEPAPTLTRAARWKVATLDPAAPAHDDSFRSWEQRFLDCGYPASANFSEILGCANVGVEALLAAWQQSPTHDPTLRDPSFVAVGIARLAVADGIVCWVLDFGSVVQ